MKKKWILIALLLMMGTALLSASYLLGNTPAAKLQKAIVKADHAASGGLRWS